MQFFAKTRDSGRLALGVGVHNAMTGRLAEQAGFDVLWLSSLEVSTEKGLPDINIITFTEMADTLREVRRATSIPILVDADNGYGSDETAVRAAQEFFHGGATALSIEDNMFPKRNSFHEGVDRVLESIDTMCRRIQAIRRAVPGLEIIARTEALVAQLGADEAEQRARAYRDAGAHAIFVQTKKHSMSEYWGVLKKVSAYATVVMTPTALPDMPAEELHARGVHVIIHSNFVIRTIVGALQVGLRELKEKQCIQGTGPFASLESIFALAKGIPYESN